MRKKAGKQHRQETWKMMKRNYVLYLFLIPTVVFIGVFCYAPMYGILMAFQNYSPSKGILGSDWVGMKWFVTFFETPRFWQIVKNTLIISVYSLIAGFPLPVILAFYFNCGSGRNADGLPVSQIRIPDASDFAFWRSGRCVLYGRCQIFFPYLCLVRDLAEYRMELDYLSGSSCRSGPGTA